MFSPLPYYFHFYNQIHNSVLDKSLHFLSLFIFRYVTVFVIKICELGVLSKWISFKWCLMSWKGGAKGESGTYLYPIFKWVPYHYQCWIGITVSLIPMHQSFINSDPLCCFEKSTVQQMATNLFDFVKHTLCPKCEKFCWAPPVGTL